MPFNRDSFSPVFITGTQVPRTFAYASDDTLDEIMSPGYFNSQRIMILKNSMIDVVCKDAAVRLIVDPPEGLNVVIRREVFQARPRLSAMDLMEQEGQKDLTPAEKRAITNAKKKEAAAATLAQTG